MIPLVKKLPNGRYSRPNVFHIVFLWGLSILLVMHYKLRLDK